MGQSLAGKNTVSPSVSAASLCSPFTFISGEPAGGLKRRMDAVAAHRRPAPDRPGAACRGVSLVVLTLAACTATCAVSRQARHGGGAAQHTALAALAQQWINSHSDSMLGYSGLRTVMPGEVAYKTPWSATPLAMQTASGQSLAVLPYPMAAFAGMERARPFPVYGAAIRQQTTTSFSDTPDAPPTAPSALPQVLPQAGEEAPFPQSPAAAFSAYPATMAGSFAGYDSPVAYPYGLQGFQSRRVLTPGGISPAFTGFVQTSGTELGNGVSGFPTAAGYMPQAAYDMQTGVRLQRGYVPIRTVIPASSLSGLPRPALPALAQGTSVFRPGAPISSYDPNNVNSGLVKGHDVNTAVGLPPIPDEGTRFAGDHDSVASSSKNRDPKKAAQDGGHQVDNHGDGKVLNPEERKLSTDLLSLKQWSHPSSEAYKIDLPAKIAGRAVPICDTELVMIDKTKPPSAHAVACVSLDEVRKRDGAATYAALEEIVDAQALLQDRKQTFVSLPQGGLIAPDA